MKVQNQSSRETNDYHQCLVSILAASCALYVSTQLQAADRSSSNVQALHGTDYADNFGIDDKEKTVLTLAHAYGWAYGDNFFFLDASNPTSHNTNLYNEFSPRFNIGKMTGSDLSFPGVKDGLIGSSRWAFEGFADFAYGQDGGTNPKNDNIAAAPQPQVDISNLWGSPGALQGGHRIPDMAQQVR